MSMSTAGSWRGVGLAAAGLVAAFGLFRAGASSAPQTAPPPAAVVALVDLTKITKGLNEMKDRNDLLDKKRADFQKQIGDLKEKGTKAAEDYKLLPAGSKQAREKYLEMQEIEQNLKARGQVLQILLDADTGEILSDVYKKLLATCEKIAAKDGYTLVMLDDRSVELPTNPTPEDVNRVILARRVLYAAPTLDITERVVTEMNNEYTAPAKRN